MKEEKIVNKILDFWFGKINENGLPEKKIQKIWCKKDKKVDEKIRDEFEEMLKQAISGRFKQCLNSPEGTLSVIILLDQFSRNIYRDTPRAFSQDQMALNISLKGIDRGFDKKLIYVKRSFFYMPLMHSEDTNMQNKPVICFSELEKEFGKEDGIADLVKKNKKYVVMHYGIIDKFGRFPHRNRILSREYTKEEIEFLKRPGNSF